MRQFRQSVAVLPLSQCACLPTESPSLPFNLIVRLNDQAILEAGSVIGSLVLSFLQYLEDGLRVSKFIFAYRDLGSLACIANDSPLLMFCDMRSMD